MPSDGFKALRRSAAEGNPAAAAYAAVLAALGAGEAQDWPLALRRLARAAELGSASARRQLQLLSGLTDASWAEMASAVDLTSWLTRAAVEPVGGNPRVLVSRSFLPPAACAWLIELARGRLARAGVYDLSQLGVAESEHRSNSAFEFAMADLDLVIVLMRAKIAATVGVEMGALEPAQMLHYAPGQTFEPHYDFLDPKQPGHAAEIARNGQRMATFLIYVNEDYEGGHTDFPELGKSVKGRTGDALMFANLDAAGEPDFTMRHAGLPPTRGEKWLVSQWIRAR